MQEGRAKAKTHAKRVSEMEAHGIRSVDTRGKYERMLDNVRRK